MPFEVKKNTWYVAIFEDMYFVMIYNKGCCRPIYIVTIPRYSYTFTYHYLNKGSFLKLCFLCKDSHTCCIAAALLDLFDDRSYRKHWSNSGNKIVYLAHFGPKMQSFMKAGIIKIIRVSLSLLQHQS